MRHFICGLLLIVSFSSIAQEKKLSLDYKDTPLSKVIRDVETFFSIRFSYNSDLLIDRNFSYNGNLDLEGVINELRFQNNLSIRKVDAANYLVVKTKEQGIRICGIIKDHTYNEPLEFASIYVPGEQKGTASGQDGRFILDGLNVDDQVEIQFVGHETLRIPVARFVEGECLDIVLLSNPIQLAVVPLREYLTRGFDRNNQDGSVQLKPRRLGILPGLTEPDVLQSLQLLPGISSPLETASGLHVRGGTPDQNLVLWDGIKMYHQGHFFGQISAFNPYITDKVHVYRSGTSSRYGDRISGVIDITSVDEIPHKLQAGAGFNLTQADLYIKAPVTNNFALIASGRRSFADVLETVTYQKLGEKVFQNTKIIEGQNSTEENFEELSSIFEFTDFNIKAIWRPTSKDKLAFSTLLLKNNLDYEVQTDELNTTDQLKVTNNGYSVKWDHTASDALSWSLKGYLSQYDSDFSFLEREIEVDETEGFVSQKRNAVGDLGISLQSRYHFSEKTSLLAGYEFSNNRVSYIIDEIEDGEQEISEDESERLSNHAIFAEYQLESESTLLRGGLRVNWLATDSNLLFEPRVYFETRVLDHLRIKASGEIKNQYISQLIEFESNDIGVGNNIWVLADAADIPVLNNQQLTTGFLFSNNGWNIDLDVFYKRIEGLTTFSRGFNNTGNGTEGDYAEGLSDAYGMDILLKKRVGNFRSWISYSLSKTQFNFPELQESQFPGNFDQRHVITLSNTYKWKDLQFSLGWTFASGRPFSQPTGVETVVDENGFEDVRLVYQDQNGERLENYHRLDASVVYDFYLLKGNKYRSRIGISALNLYQRENEIGKEFRIDEDEDATQIIERTQFGLGFTPNLVFRVSF
ncbi:MAG: TonB-dependent receptor [Bacteroidota bacterium]